jgi:MT0933-like antitoxin protein
MPLLKRLAVLVTAAEAARRYAKSNPDQAARIVDQAAQFVDKQTKGKYSGQIKGAADKAKGLAGIRQTPGYGVTGNGYTQSYDQNAGFGKPAGHTTPPPPSAPRGTTPPGATNPPPPGPPRPER